MARFFASLILVLLLLSSGAQAVVFAALQPEVCDGSACCCASDELDGPTLERVCCCAVEPLELPDSEMPPVFVETESSSVPMPTPCALMSPFEAPHSVQLGSLLRPFPPRAPPVGVLRLHCVQRC